MSNILDAYLWGYQNWEAGFHSLRKFKEFYPKGKIHIQVDKGGSFDEYQKVASQYSGSCSENPFKLGYPGNHQNHIVGRKCWPKECTLLWLDNLYNFCLVSNSKFIIVLEEDSFILKPLSILNKEFGIAGFEYNTNTLPSSLLYFIEQMGGNINIPLNLFGNKGYGAGGGFIIDRKKWMLSWDKVKPLLDLNYDELQSYSHLIGWSDCVAQLVIMGGGYEVTQNGQMVQTWYHERPDLYPTYTHWSNYEIVDYLKDIEEIKKL